jgi:hypothetical protein
MPAAGVPCMVSKTCVLKPMGAPDWVGRPAKSR